MERVTKTGNLQADIDGFNNQTSKCSIAINARATQSSAVNAWIRFCKFLNINYLLSDFSLITENTVLSFLGFEIGLRGLNPKARSISDTYLSAINREFVERRVSNHFNNAIHSGIIKHV